MSNPSLNLIRGLIIDMDGVLWRDDQPIGDLPAVFAAFAALGWQPTLATNNATRSVELYQEKLRRFGVNLQEQQIVTSADAAAGYLQQHLPGGSSIYVVGENPLIEVLARAGFSHSTQGIRAVVVSFDRQFTYEKLRLAAGFIRSGALFIATNPDRTFPTPQGLIPGAGAILAAVQAAVETPAVIIGKPFPEMYQEAMHRMGIQPENTLVVGDRLETDIAGGQRLGCQTALVMSGVTSPDQAQKWVPQPDWTFPDLTSLVIHFSLELGVQIDVSTSANLRSKPS